MEAYGRIDIIVNNAATNPVYAPIAQVEGNIFDKIMSSENNNVLNNT